MIGYAAKNSYTILEIFFSREDVLAWCSTPRRLRTRDFSDVSQTRVKETRKKIKVIENRLNYPRQTASFTIQ